MKPPMALGLAAILAGANPKNFVLAAAGAAVIAQTGIPAGQQSAAYVVFAAISTVGLAAPVVIFFAAGDRAPRVLRRLKDLEDPNNAVIMAVLFLVFAA